MRKVNEPWTRHCIKDVVKEKIFIKNLKQIFQQNEIEGNHKNLNLT